MSSEWSKVILKDVLKEKGYIRGPFGSALKRNQMKALGIPVYEQQNIIYNHRNFRYYIDNEKYMTMKRFAVKENDLIISCSGTVGKVSLIKAEDEKGIISQALLLLRSDSEKILPQYLKYFFVSPEGYNSLISRSHGSVQVNIAKRNVIENIELLLPNILIQEKIVSILTSFDDKIENNRKTCEKLEEMAQTIFKQWFVDFEFPNEDGKPYKSSGGEMRYCEEFGKEIPTGWKHGNIKDCCLKIQNGGTPKRNKKEYWDSNDVPWLTSGEVRKNIINQTFSYISELGLENSSAKWVPSLSTVVALYGATAGQVALLSIDVTTNQAICGLIPKRGFTYFNYLLLGLSSKELFNKAIGSAQQNISKKIVEEFELSLPDITVLERFDDKISSLYDQIISGINQINTLETIRDTLLPKLMRGELSVDDLEVLDNDK